MHRLIRSGMVVALCASSPISAFADNWPTAAKSAPVTKPESKPDAKPVAKSAPKAAAPVAKAAVTPAVAKAEAAPVAVKAVAPVAVAPVIQPRVESSADIKALTELVARQSAAIEALTKRLDACGRSPKSAPVAAVVMPGAPAATPAAAPAAAAAAQTTRRARPPLPRAPSRRWATSAGPTCSSSLSGSVIARSTTAPACSRTTRARTTPASRHASRSTRPGTTPSTPACSAARRTPAPWNNTGMGTGDPARDLHLKQLYFAAAPVSGLEFQYGGLYVARGEGTEITTYDNDGYLTGQRVTVKQPKQLWFDEVSATQAYLGDAKVPDMWNRYQRLTESNYYQVLVRQESWEARRRLRGLHRSGRRPDVAQRDRIQGADGRARRLRFEGYARSEVGPTPFGWALTLDKKVGRTSMSGGYASIDEHYGGLNGDYYNKGNRWFGKATATCSRC